MSIRMGRSLAGGLLSASLATSAAAEVPAVAADIAPVHGLVARVMQGLGEPALVVRPGASPHGYAMRPSEARALEQADAVFWIGPALEPWLEHSIATLASDAVAVELLGTPGTVTREFRSGATFDAPGHASEAAGNQERTHRDDNHAPAEDAQAHGGGVDPHAWLDPENAKVWLGAIADELAALDPENAESYAANAGEGAREIDAAAAEVERLLAPLQDMTFIVFHDAYQYFEARFGLSAAGAISVADAEDPSPARLETIRDAVGQLAAACVFSEPQFDQGIVRTVLGGTDGQSGVIDPLGFEIPAGPGFYPALLRSVAEEMAACAS
jgi:zinc transport system substrate-binding protein